MELDRGVLARIDRKLLARLGQDETYRMVRVPATEGKWPTWKRYCEAGLSMGRAIVSLIDHELSTVVGDSSRAGSPVLAGRAEEERARSMKQVARREENAVAVEERLRAWNADLRSREVEFAARERRVELAARVAVQCSEPATKLSRDERCPCGSGLKYKHCHGLPGR